MYVGVYISCGKGSKHVKRLTGGIVGRRYIKSLYTLLIIIVSSTFSCRICLLTVTFYSVKARKKKGEDRSFISNW